MHYLYLISARGRKHDNKTNYNDDIGSLCKYHNPVDTSLDVLVTNWLILIVRTVSRYSSSSKGLRYYRDGRSDVLTNSKHWKITQIKLFFF